MTHPSPLKLDWCHECGVSTPNANGICDDHQADYADPCECPACASDCAGIVPCVKEGADG